MRRGDIGPRDERLRAPNIRAVPSPRAVESTEGPAFDVTLFGLTPVAEAGFFPARALRLARLPFRVGRLPAAGEAQPVVKWFRETLLRRGRESE